MGRVLRIGLSGGIGSGKSTVAERFAEHGAMIIDADVIAREVVAPGTSGLAEIAERFGDGVLDAEGALDRPAMARRVFGDDEARAQLNGIVHPRIAARTAELMAAAPADAIVVHDIPLLVEAGYGPNYHLVVIVDAPEEDRVRRLIGRGLPESDARARIRAQATPEQRREAADVWLDNTGSVADVLSKVDALWADRLVRFEANVRRRTWTPRGSARLVEPDADWPRQARRLAARIGGAVGDLGLGVEHIGSTSVPGLPAKDVVDFQVSVRSMADADAAAEALGEAGFPVVPDMRGDNPKPGSTDPASWSKRTHVSADPGRAANVHLRVAGNPNWRYALLFRDWMRSDDTARDEYAAVKRELASRFVADTTNERYVAGKQPWFDRAWSRAEHWAERTGWQPPTD